MPNTYSLSRSQFERLRWELSQAVSAVPRQALTAWSKRTALLLGKTTFRRGKGLVKLAAWIAKGSVNEAFRLAGAGIDGELGTYIKKRRKDAVDAVGHGAKAVGSFADRIIKELLINPVEAGPRLFAGMLGLYAGSGGIDAEGGIPDLDLIAGLRLRRFAIAHSLLMGALIETGTFALADLVSIVYHHFPDDHDPFWDKLVTAKDKIAKAFSKGASAGVAWHLLDETAVQAAVEVADLTEKKTKNKSISLQ